jgi:hypothetical protein
VVRVYSWFVSEVAASGRAWGLGCCGDLVAVHGDETPVVFPLWPDAESARACASEHWPDLQTTEIPLSRLLRYLPELEREGIAVGLGVAPYPDALVVTARRLRRSLLERRGRRRPGARPPPATPPRGDAA